MVSISRPDDDSVENVIVTSTWGRSILQRTEFPRQAANTEKFKYHRAQRKSIIIASLLHNKYSISSQSLAW